MRNRKPYLGGGAGEAQQPLTQPGPGEGGLGAGVWNARLPRWGRRDALETRSEHLVLGKDGHAAQSKSGLKGLSGTRSI